jgi:glutathione S-transferase
LYELAGAQPERRFNPYCWRIVMSPLRLLEPDDPVFAWRERMLDLYGGLGRNAVGYPVRA